MSAPLVVLVGCGASKLSRPAKARDLYTGRIFKASLAYALALTPRVWVVSARHGLLDLDRVIEPYNWTLTDIGGKRDRDNWGERVVTVLGNIFRDTPPRVTLLMGDEYAAPLRGPIRFRASEHFAGARWPAPAEEPLRGIRTIGLRVRALQELTATASSEAQGAAL